MFKVGVWGPGSMGLIALRGVIDHPRLELVDLVVHSGAKAGRDAGELCGIDPVGVAATQDPAAMLAGDADAVVYAAAANLRPAEAIGARARHRTAAECGLNQRFSTSDVAEAHIRLALSPGTDKVSAWGSMVGRLSAPKHWQKGELPSAPYTADTR